MSPVDDEGFLGRFSAGLSYEAAGVDVRAGERFVNLIKPLARRTRRPEVLGALGGFAGLFRFPRGRYKDPVLVSGTDGVGTKLKVAFLADRHESVGIDLVAMCVNDVVVTGAEPLFFLDYFATGRIEPKKAARVVRGIAAGCREAGCALLGGETAELPSMYAEGEYDLAGFCVGAAERSAIVDGRRIRPGDALVGLASSGLHSNGFSLVRKIVFERMGLKVGDRFPGLRRSVGEVLLRPTRIYVRPVLALLRDRKLKGAVKGMAHVTGGGMTGNLPRVLPAGCRAVIERSAWAVPEVFSVLGREGQVATAEMFRTFNMGVGMVLVVAAGRARAVAARARALGERAFVMGEIVRGARGVRYA